MFSTTTLPVYARTDEAAKAVEYLTALADKAARTYANTEAVTALEIGIRLASDDLSIDLLDVAQDLDQLHFLVLADTG